MLYIRAWVSYTRVMSSTSAHITHDASARAGRACVHVRTANPLERAPGQHERDHMHTSTQSPIERPALTPSQIADRTPPLHAMRSAAADLLRRLDAEKAVLARFVDRDLRSGRGPSPEMKAASAKANCTWRLWSNAVDTAEGRLPCFPVDGAGQWLSNAHGGAK